MKNEKKAHVISYEKYNKVLKTTTVWGCLSDVAFVADLQASLVKKGVFTKRYNYLDDSGLECLDCDWRF